MLTLVIVAVVAGGVYLLANLFFSHSTAKSEKIFSDLSRDYYENFLYPNFVKEHADDNLDEVFSEYEKKSFEPVKLRQILNYNTYDKKIDYREYFQNEKFKCNTNTSSVEFTPVAPYGKNDYKMTVVLNCEEN